jgi:hypothetical protein
MISEDIFHQRGITLLYRGANLIIQSGLYGKFRSLTPHALFTLIPAQGSMRYFSRHQHT